MDPLIVIIFAILGGILPAVFWLYIWLKEDSKHPEPTKLLIRTFLAGMACVPIAMLCQYIIVSTLSPFGSLSVISIIAGSTTLIGIVAITLGAIIEEILKFSVAHFTALETKNNDEPLDPVIYMITAALGIAALENIIYLIAPILEGQAVVAIIMGNARFLGSTLLHVACSAIIGFSLSFTYFKPVKNKVVAFFIGFGLATLLHVVFNFLIIRNVDDSKYAFAIVWIIIALVLFAFEKVKKIHLSKINTIL